MAVVYGKYTPSVDLVTSGLIGHWDALESASYSGSGSSWNDLSGLNNTATLQNSPTFNNDGTGSFTLNGTNQWIDMAPSYPTNGFPRYDNAATISIWFKTGSSAPNLSLFGIGGNFTNGQRINMWISSQTINCETVNDGIGTDIGNYSLNTWYNFAVVKPQAAYTSNLKLYVNGVDHTATYGGTNNWYINMASIGSGQCVIGTIPGYNIAYFFPGTIAIPLVYNRALTASEVLQNFEARRSRFGI